MPSINRSQIGNWHGLLNIRIDALTVLLGHREIAAVNRIVPYLHRAGVALSGTETSSGAGRYCAIAIDKPSHNVSGVSRSAIVTGALVDALKYRSSFAICSNVQRRR